MEKECVWFVTPFLGQRDTKMFLRGHPCLCNRAWEPSNPRDLDPWQADDGKSQSAGLQSENELTDSKLHPDKHRSETALCINDTQR